MTSADGPPARRRSPKGAARRSAILEAALNAYATSDRLGPRLRDIAEAAGVTEAGVLHHFGSKDELFVAILRRRDENATSLYDFSTAAGQDAFLVETTTTPGLTKLFVDMSAAAADPGHPAHAFMAEHRAVVASMIAQLAPGADPEAIDAVVALAEGLQLQWLSDPTIDIAGRMRRFSTILLGLN
ncbi:MAG: TetR family transcriptional regulator [Rhodococcus sp. (in: high G+C Gram-positive bacteria)]|uniref:TetR/AcrR family transcriptional regulator n=1 Tax=Rhodococcus sp. TaxID=1831 RepID=UPI002AD5FA77|nr:TetR family transcriptional regulator [Rhodococcus sp. (in: high G+C Gram-positive bacteria)]